MLYYFFYPLSSEFAFFNIFKYITFRAALAFIISAIFSIIVGKRFIAFMKAKQFGQMIRDVGPESHKKKAGTPTMGGAFIFLSVVFTMIIFGNFSSEPLIYCLAIYTSYFFLGLLDDYLKILKKNSDGVSAKGKLLWQFLTAALCSYALIIWSPVTTDLYLPFFKWPVVNLGYVFIPFVSIVIVGSSNAVNLTDGLDGLAIGPVMTSASVLGILAYLSGHTALSSYLFIPYFQGLGELTVLASAIVGASMGFLWYNSYPAQIFMGDVGSLSLGGVLGAMAVVTKNEFLFVIIGGIFVIEALSVIIQVFYFKATGKRVFKMAPIHHHFELKGWPEPKVIVRFWILSILMALVALATLKIR